MGDRPKTASSKTFSKQSFDQYSIEDWQEIATKSLRGQAPASLSHITANGLHIDPLYSDRPETIGKISPSPLQRWDNRLAVLGDTAVAQNAFLLTGLRGGNSSAQIQLDNPELKSTIKIEQLSAVLENVQLDIVPISVIAGSHFAMAAEQMESIWSRQNIDAVNAAASFNADPIGTLASTGRLSTELDKLLTDMGHLAQHSHKNFPLVKTICVNSTCYHNAGASLEQELVASIATASIYMQTMLDAGMSAQSAHDAISFQVACDADNLVNVVKLRALKALWHHVANHFGVAKADLPLVVETSLRMQSRNQPWVNHLRNVSAAAAAAMGGAQSIIVHPHNRIDGIFIDDDIELSTRVARNIAIIISEESAMTFIHDPMGGSYTIENLTNALCKDTWVALQQLENDGGLVQALNGGQWQSQISATQKKRVARLHDEQDVQVAVNRYTTQTEQAKHSTKQSIQTDAESEITQALLTVRDAKNFEEAS